MTNLTPLQQILHAFRTASVTEREKGIYFEELICLYLRNEPTYADLYSDVWMLVDVPHGQYSGQQTLKPAPVAKNRPQKGWGVNSPSPPPPTGRPASRRGRE